MELNAIGFLSTATLHNNHSLYTKLPLCCCNCPIKIFLLEDVSYYTPSGSLWTCLQPINWTFVSGSHCNQKGLQADLGAACRPQNRTHCTRRQNRKLTFGLCLEATPLSSTLESGDRASDLYHGNNDLFWCQELRGLPRGARHLWWHVTVFLGESLHSALW